MEEYAKGRLAIERYAPAASGALARLEAAIWSAADELGIRSLVDSIVTLVAGQHGLHALGAPAPGVAAAGSDGSSLAPGGSSAGEVKEIGRAFAERMSFNVASLDDKLRQDFLATYGPSAFPIAQIIYVADFLPRILHALEELDAGTYAEESAELECDSPGAATESTAVEALGAAFDEWIRVVPRLEGLDPVLTELVRLRGAGHHECRVCQSIRYLPALEAGAADSLMDSVITQASAAQTPAQAAALAFADELLATPGRLSHDVLRAVKDNFLAAAQVELVLDIARNATNKLAVAFAADAPRVETGFEICAADENGELRYGLPDPRSRPGS